MKEKLHCILLVDDDATTNFLNKRLLSRMEIVEEIKVASNGVKALEYIKNTLPENTEFPIPQLIFLDINMPLMTGWEFLEAYQALPTEYQQSVVIVMLTTSLRPEDKDRADTMNEVQQMIFKPLKAEHINTILDKHFPGMRNN